MEAIIRTENQSLFDGLVHFLKTIPITVLIKEEKKSEKKAKKNGIDINDFSFIKSMEASKNFKGSLSDALIEERRSG